jgi:hypothetical protein
MAMSFERFCFSRRDLYRMSWVVVDPKTFESAARNQSFPAYVGTFLHYVPRWLCHRIDITPTLEPK